MPASGCQPSRRTGRLRHDGLLQSGSSLVVLIAILYAFGCAFPPFVVNRTTRVSVSSSAVEANSDSADPRISADGRFVAFVSTATNLVAGDGNGKTDVFVHDRQTGQTTRVSVSSAGTEADGSSFAPSISSEGRYVAFSSQATNLVGSDANGKTDVFVHDRQTAQTTRVSISSGAAEADGASGSQSISADGRYVAFSSNATNLVAGDTNGKADIFVHDRQTGQTSRVSISSAAAESNGDSLVSSISADGRYVAFTSGATNLVSGDTNGTDDIFVHDRQTGQTARVSVSSAATEADDDSYTPSISADGRYVSFYSYATNLVSADTNGKADVFVHDRQTGQTTRVSVSSAAAEANDHSDLPAISPDGRYVAFYTGATNLVADDSNGHEDIFLHDRQTGRTTRISVSSDGVEANGPSYTPSVSADGRQVVFYSGATNLVPGDTNAKDDIFVRDRGL
jgi:Tol biopolymer transport system component